MIPLLETVPGGEGGEGNEFFMLFEHFFNGFWPLADPSQAEETDKSINFLTNC